MTRPIFRNLFDENLLMIDGARHARLRGLVSKAFTPRRVEGLADRVEAIVDELLDRAAARGSLDVVRDLARPLPGIVIGELLGTPGGDNDMLLRWSEELVELLDPLSGTDGIEPPRRATTAAAAYFRRLLAERRASPRDDLLSAMITAELDGESLSEGELIALCTLILAAGHETTVNLIGSAVLLLLRHPGERKRLQDDPGLLGRAVEECLRFEPPVQFTDRAVVSPCDLGGVRLRPGAIVAVVIAAANRDPARFSDPGSLRRVAQRRAPPLLRARLALLPRRRPRAAGDPARGRRPAAPLPGFLGQRGSVRVAPLRRAARPARRADRAALGGRRRYYYS